MTNSFVLMTAMPPTTGHLQLIQFASLLTKGTTTVIVNTQPAEPLSFERVAALRTAVRRVGIKNVSIKHTHRSIEQNPQAPGFWEMWKSIMKAHGATKDDYIVASEPYGKQVAALTGSQFFPYDLERSLNCAKAAVVRENTLEHFTKIIPEFQKHLRSTITLFGAESTGKTTLSRQLANNVGGQWLFEYARPYLENTANEINTDSMKAIWKGQAALQRQADNLTNSPYVVQDTDLFSTVGYWSFPHWKKVLGECPKALINEAIHLQSDMYIITKSNIPFEQDPLRYGGDTREGSDQYWIDVCERFELPYVVLESSDDDERLRLATQITHKVASQKTSIIAYDRKGL